MKKIVYILSIFLCVFCSKKEVNSSDTPPDIREKEKDNIIYIYEKDSKYKRKAIVHNFREFIKVLDDDTEIVLDLKELDASLTDFQFSEFEKLNSRVTYSNYYGLTLSKFQNLKIKADKQVDFYINNEYSAVLTFVDSDNIILENLNFYHNVYDYYTCDGYVINFIKGKDITLTHCKMNGSGRVGLNLYEIKNANIINCEIYNNSYTMLMLENSKNIIFDNTQFYKNFCEGYLINVSSSQAIFQNCIFKDNYTEFGFINPFDEEETSLQFINCSIKNNIEEEGKSPEQILISKNFILTSKDFDPKDVVLNHLHFVREGESEKDFIPQGWKVLKKVTGDLNKDGINDMAFVIENTSKDNFIQKDWNNREILNLNPRYLLIAFGDSLGKIYKLTTLKKNFIPSQNDKINTCLYDPLEEGNIQIKKGVLSISLNYWYSCGSYYTNTDTYVFRYQNNDFELVGYDSQEYSRNSGEKTVYSMNFSTSKMKITTNNMFNADDKKQVKWIDFKPIHMTIKEISKNTHILDKISELNN